MTDTAKLRAGIIHETDQTGYTSPNSEATEALMAEAADEIEELRREVAKLTPLATVAEIEHRLSVKPSPGGY